MATQTMKCDVTATRNQLGEVLTGCTAATITALIFFAAPAFGQAVAVPQAAASDARPPARRAAPAGLPTVRSRAVTVALRDDTFQLRGSMLETPTISLKTSFGATKIPVNEIAGVKMAQDGVPSTTVVLQNGDSITGAIEMDRLIIETTWGKAAIYATNIDSIMFAPGLKWTSQEGLNGTRWFLQAEQSAQQPQTGGTASANGTSSRPVTAARPVYNGAAPATYNAPQPLYYDRSRFGP